ncbi:MAG: twin-arginine translocase TatA/TatE family subunit [Bacillota bacterium]|nr:twin-arginine translocase TatA/TatE family subunit [Bacillota bacterium]MDW7684038.1 twin-arginine translocase TatA/TatE family subunit [Bacillota bacterium]
MISKIGLTEILLVFGVALLVFGPAKLPDIGRSFGKGIREFKDATKEITQTITEAEEEKTEKT